MERLQELMSSDLNVFGAVLLLILLSYLAGLFGSFGVMDWKIDRMYRYFRNKYEEEYKKPVGTLDKLHSVYYITDKQRVKNFLNKIKEIFTKKQK